MVYADQTVRLWMNETQLSVLARGQLSTVTIRPYGSFLADLNVIASAPSVNTIWISSSASQAIFNRIPAQKRLIASSFSLLQTHDTRRSSLSFSVPGGNNESDQESH